MAAHKSLDPRARPPAIIQNTYKKYQKKRDWTNYQDDTLVDLTQVDSLSSSVRQISTIDRETILSACLAIENHYYDESARRVIMSAIQTQPIYESSDLPGLLIIPSLLPPRTQKILLSKLLHRDLSKPEHLTNVHFHHRLPYPKPHKSFFSLDIQSHQCEPLDPTTHRPIPLAQLLNKKLRWATLGGQYDWSAKKYPDVKPPAFPPDTAQLLETLFPQMRAEAAIVNLYTPGDFLSMHRDVAEESDKGLISVSIGCEAVFVIGLGPDNAALSPGNDGSAIEMKPPLVIRLRSGDAVFMGGSSRFAWHGVPQIIPGTCPDFLKDWPASIEEKTEPEYEQWRGWMANKRVNLNVRQMWD
ncbi:hypothetical protein BT63DRAFT_454761 [Microthyrium microscopicum]|uniref:mRNA N(6)-methyladenine demethylase n=1 Tax=Microthyrium microscopicum TaxID=703497 RepID=A0A6A6UE59_9PEZI|nr:hypothetical protein BT63DRAFT_454761 [Microthyrium microscopicum]